MGRSPTSTRSRSGFDNWIVERSPRFRWPAGDVPAEAYLAHATLVDALVREGWRPTG